MKNNNLITPSDANQKDFLIARIRKHLGLVVEGI